MHKGQAFVYMLPRVSQRNALVLINALHGAHFFGKITGNGFWVPYRLFRTNPAAQYPFGPVRADEPGRLPTNVRSVRQRIRDGHIG